MACGTPDEVKDKQCGMCGKQSIVCLAGSILGNRWSAWSECTGEGGSCMPGTSRAGELRQLWNTDEGMQPVLWLVGR